MCGRYYRKKDKQKIAEAFHATKVDDFVVPPRDYNVAPTRFVEKMICVGKRQEQLVAA